MHVHVINHNSIPYYLRITRLAFIGVIKRATVFIVEILRGYYFVLFTLDSL